MKISELYHDQIKKLKYTIFSKLKTNRTTYEDEMF